MLTRVKETRIKIGKASIVVPLHFADKLKDDLIIIEVLAGLIGFDLRYYDAGIRPGQDFSVDITIGHNYINSAGMPRFDDIYTLIFKVSKLLKLSSVSLFSCRTKEWIVKEDQESIFKAIEELKKLL